MKLPPFGDFVKSVDMDALSYDLSAAATPLLKESSALFTQEQYDFLTQTAATMNLVLLRQYHQWLSEQLAE